jgi:aminoglycoside phosphotransferase family enzyme/predicted kinase
MELTGLIEALSNPRAYPYRVEKVEIRQTHISVVFLAGPCVYKVKKSVNLGFLDFSTLQKRYHFCEEEVRLNRRLAPQVYLGVVPVARTQEGVRLEGQGEVVEWAVKMQRLPDDATLRGRLRRNEVGNELVHEFARRIAAFHRGAGTNERIAAFGRFDMVAQLVRDVFMRAAPEVGTTVLQGVFDRIGALSEEWLTRLRPLLEARAVRGMTRDCHGDLHLDHVYYFPERQRPDDLVIIDCIEFNERFRFLDPVADMAFAVMDLAFCGRRDLARAFAGAYFHESGDEEGRTLLPLYTAYRAAVRGMVEGLLLAEKEVAAAEQATARSKARAHWLLALTELDEPARKPCLLLVSGLPGSGKSRLARGLAEAAGFCVIRSDVVRKELAGLPSDEPTPPHLRESLYTPDWNEHTYAECRRMAEQLLFEGKRVLVDATFREERQRQAFLETAVHFGVPGYFLVCRAPAETVRQRLEERRGDASDADWAVYLQIAESWEEVGAATQRALLEVSTERNPAQSLSGALAMLRDLGLFGEAGRD